jgi:hypothetical protein
VYTALSTQWEPVVVSSGVRSDESGRLQNLETTAFYREDDDRGESLQIEVVADDGSVYAVDKVFPFPIEAKDGPCHVYAEVANATRDGYFLWLDGFQPGEDVQIRSADSCDVQEGTRMIGPDGRSMVGVLHCGPAGMAVFSVSAQHCKVVLAYGYRPQADGLP